MPQASTTQTLGAQLRPHKHEQNLNMEKKEVDNWAWSEESRQVENLTASVLRSLEKNV